MDVSRNTVDAHHQFDARLRSARQQLVREGVDDVMLERPRERVYEQTDVGGEVRRTLCPRTG